MQEGLNEWLIMDEQTMRFYMDQYERPYKSTVKFLEYLQKKSKRITESWILGVVLAWFWII